MPGAEMRSPNVPLCGCGHSEVAHIAPSLGGLTGFWGCLECDRDKFNTSFQHMFNPVSPRSSGGAPKEEFRGHGATPCDECGEIMCRCEGSPRWKDEHIEALRTQVSALRQQLADFREVINHDGSLETHQEHVDTLCDAMHAFRSYGKVVAENERLESTVSALRQEAAARNPIPCSVCLGKPLVSGGVCICGGLGTQVAELLGKQTAMFSELSAARQEAETLTRQRDAAIREISVIAREAETLRGQLDKAQKALGTEQTMHRAWRKRAEEAEAERAATGLSVELTPLTDEQRAAFDDFVRASLETDKEVIAKLRRELLERNFPRAARVAAPREPK